MNPTTILQASSTELQDMLACLTQRTSWFQSRQQQLQDAMEKTGQGMGSIRQTILSQTPLPPLWIPVTNYFDTSMEPPKEADVTTIKLSHNLQCSPHPTALWKRWCKRQLLCNWESVLPEDVHQFASDTQNLCKIWEPDATPELDPYNGQPLPPNDPDKPDSWRPQKGLLEGLRNAFDVQYGLDIGVFDTSLTHNMASYEPLLPFCDQPTWQSVLDSVPRVSALWCVKPYCSASM